MTIQELQGMSRKEFAMTIKTMNKEVMIKVITEYGVYVKTSLKSMEVLEVLCDVVDGVIIPTEEDAKKLERKIKIQNSRNKYILYPSQNEHTKKFIEWCKEISKKHEGYFMVSALPISNCEAQKFIDELNDEKKELKVLYRKASMACHPDCNAGKDKVFKMINERNENKVSFMDSILEGFYKTIERNNKIEALRIKWRQKGINVDELSNEEIVEMDMYEKMESEMEGEMEGEMERITKQEVSKKRSEHCPF